MQIDLKDRFENKHPPGAKALRLTILPYEMLPAQGSPFFKRSKYGHCPEGGRGFNPCPNVFGALFYGALYLGKMPKGGWVKALPKDLDHS